MQSTKQTNDTKNSECSEYSNGFKGIDIATAASSYCHEHFEDT